MKVHVLGCPNITLMYRYLFSLLCQLVAN